MFPAQSSAYYRWTVLAVPWPALMIGVLLMREDGIAATVWGQNLVGGALLTILCAGVLLIAPPPPKASWRGLAVIFSVTLLLLTFANAGLMGVHRWVQAGPVRLYAGAVTLPILIIVLGKWWAVPKKNPAEALALLLALGVLAVLALQPDAALATAFAGALLAMIARSRRPLRLTWWAALGVVACAAWAWLRPDPLPSVRHVEGIIGMAAERGTLWLVASLLSLGLLPWPFLLARREDGQVFVVAFALGVYFLLNLIVPAFGAFPVPLMGYGLSPIAGYFIALAWLLAARRPTRAGE
jgi:cell division protein FtsW (lipid II flippase)